LTSSPWWPPSTKGGELVDGEVVLDAVAGDQRVHEAAVEVDALRARLTDTVGEERRPGDGEPIGRRTDVPDQVHVFLVPVVVVIGDVAVVVIVDVAGRVCVRVPDGLTLAVLVPAPSIWYEDVATPQRNPSGKRRPVEVPVVISSGPP